MKRVRITIRNYRGFADSEPISIELGHGFTALLGRNNVGKSALKLFFYELRPLFGILSQKNSSISPNLYGIFSPGPLQANFLGLTDPEEIFNNTNNRPCGFEIELLGAEPRSEHQNCLVRMTATCSRSSPHTWTFSTFGKANPSANLSAVGVKPTGVGVVNHQIEGGLDCLDFIDVMEAFRDARYYGPFRNAINQGAGDHFDLKVGTSFIDLWDAWKTSGVKAHTRAIGKVTEDIRSLFEFGRLEINASVSLKTLIVTIDGQPYRLNELGSGLAQFIMVLGNAATTAPSLVLIDEPETNLHPALQIDFLLAVAQYARLGCLFSTHSVGLARSVADQIYTIQKQSSGAIVRPFEATPNYLEFIGELSFSVFKELGCDRLLLVEGVNDVKTVQQFLRHVKKEHTTVILPLGGDQLASGGREAELKELTRLSNNIFALVDSERIAAIDSPSSRRIQFQETCRRIGIDVCVTERRAIENYFSDSAVKAALGDNFQSLGPYELLKNSATPWGKFNNWKIARHIQWAEIESTDLGAFIARI
jgi:energy-coupling factor transporter ATP-binding protein EcfA2